MVSPFNLAACRETGSTVTSCRWAPKAGCLEAEPIYVLENGGFACNLNTVSTFFCLGWFQQAPGVSLICLGTWASGFLQGELGWPTPVLHQSALFFGFDHFGGWSNIRLPVELPNLAFGGCFHTVRPRGFSFLRP